MKREGLKQAKKFLMGKRNTNRRKRVEVSFGAKPHVVEAQPHHHNDIDCSELWYSKAESQKIRAANHQLMVVVRVQRLSDPEDLQFFPGELFPFLKDDDIRGLESWDPDFHKQAKDYRLRSLATVFSEQKAQLMEGVVDEEAIAQAYRKVSQGAADVAHRLALCDEQDLS